MLGEMEMAPRRCAPDRKSTRLNSSHLVISYAVFCLKKKKAPISSAIGLDDAGEPTVPVTHGEGGTPLNLAPRPPGRPQHAVAHDSNRSRAAPPLTV